MKDYIDTLTSELERHSNPDVALEQKAYMRNQFEFYGIKTTQRRAVFQPFFSPAHLLHFSELHGLVKTLWQRPQRDYQYFCQELVFRYIKHLEEKDMALLEYMVTQKSWWDTVDSIAPKLMGGYFKKFPQQRENYTNKWLQSNNIWLQRSTLLFQLKYKKDLDLALLTTSIHGLLGSKEFFINKAIGWILRDYSKTNPKWVMEFANKTPLSPLSRREALRVIS